MSHLSRNLTRLLLCVTIRRSFSSSDSLYSAQNTHRRLDCSYSPRCCPVTLALIYYVWLFEYIEYFALDVDLVAVAADIRHNEFPPFFFCILFKKSRRWFGFVCILPVKIIQQPQPGGLHGGVFVVCVLQPVVPVHRAKGNLFSQSRLLTPRVEVGKTPGWNRCIMGNVAISPYGQLMDVAQMRPSV